LIILQELLAVREQEEIPAEFNATRGLIGHTYQHSVPSPLLSEGSQILKICLLEGDWQNSSL